MLITKREEVTKQGFCKILWRKLRPRGSLLLEFIHSSGWGGGKRLFELDWEDERGGCFFEAEGLLTFSAFRMGANSRLGAYSNKYGNCIWDQQILSETPTEASTTGNNYSISWMKQTSFMTYK